MSGPSRDYVRESIGHDLEAARDLVRDIDRPDRLAPPLAHADRGDVPMAAISSRALMID